MVERTITYDYTERDLRLNGGMNNDLNQLNGHPKADGEEGNDYVGRDALTPRELLNGKGIVKRKKEEIVKGQITIDEIVKGNNQSVKLTPGGEIIHENDNPGEEQGHKQKSKRQIKRDEQLEQEIDLREKQFFKLKKLQIEMEKRNDNRHIFLIPRGVLVENYRENGQYKWEEFFKGNLSQDVLAVMEKKYLRLIPLIPD